MLLRTLPVLESVGSGRVRDRDRNAGAAGAAILAFFVCGSLHDLVSADHVLAPVDRVLAPYWLPAEVGTLYGPRAGRAEATVRLMLAGFLLGIVHDRRLLREAQVDLAIRWFSGTACRNDCLTIPL